MEQRTNSPYPRIDRPTLAIIGVLLVLSCALFFASDRDHDWRYYQSAFKDEVAQKFGEERAAAVTTGLQQIWVADLGRADRCITCHQAVSWKGFETAEEPFRTHPLEPLKGHPIEKFGCTACHGGQGWAVDVLEAHGEIAHWEEPLLSRALGEDYSLSGNKGALIQMNCNSCHRYDRETKGADAINMAKRLVDEKGCRACHVINNRGGRIGPDLTRVGEKAPEQYDYSRLSGQKTAFAWHVAHLKDPKAVSADSSMPNFGFNTAQAQALAMLVLSWKPSHIPAAYLAGAPRTDVPTPEQAAEEERMRTGPGAWFVETGCATCHSIQVYGVKAPAQIGPDLSNAVEDVQSRFGRTIDDFLREPTGTMSVVLSRQIILTPEQKAIAVQKLREAFAVYQKQQAEKER
ncbi:MAG: c-type cytochrome [Acidobacteria bacterium]|jgi:cbb3-type cytochrome oxidase cytochrome c subunit|nr:c-type cytochrome [Acidobacteriota bacterium]